MVLDLELFRSSCPSTTEILKENQAKRFKDVSLVDKVIENDKQWRQYRYDADLINRIKNLCSKEIGVKLKRGTTNACFPQVDMCTYEHTMAPLDLLTITPDYLESLAVDKIQKLSILVNEMKTSNQEKLAKFEKLRNEALFEIGNLLHKTVPISDNEDENEILFSSGNTNTLKPYNHVDLIEMIDGVDDVATMIAGNRGYYLKGPCALLQTALIQFALHKWFNKGYLPIYTPFFMRRDIMQEVAQLSQFDDELYKIVETNQVEEEKYLIATSEQPLAALHRNQWLTESSLPLKYIGQSTCFRREAGSHGKDTGGIFRVHQFEKIEQFVVTSPLENKSWEMMDEMIQNCKEFYEELGIAFRVVNIVSGALNNAAAKKLDLEGWFPGSKAFRELVSCSNCLDYQARRLHIRFGKTKTDKKASYVHMLNSTACATTRVICAILETYQTENGVEIPKLLKSYFPPGYPDVIPFVRTVKSVHK